MKKSSKFIKCFFLFFLLPIIIVFIGIIVFKSNLFKYKPAIILSGSMEPTLSIDDLVFTKQTEDMEVGDIISYYDANGKKVMHRIVEIDGENIITKGDANNTLDKVIEKNQVIGVYTGRIRYVGTVLRFIKSPLGMALCIMLIVLTLFFPSHKNKIKKSNVVDEKTNDEKITKMLYLEIIYSIFLLGFIIVGYYAKYQTSLEGTDITAIASWDNNIELLSEDVISFQNGQNDTKLIQFNLLYTSEVTATYNLSIDKVSDKLGVELSDDNTTIGIRKHENKFMLKINDVEGNFDISTLQTNHIVTSGNIEATYDAAQDIYSFKDNASGKTIEAKANGENNYNYSFINYGIFQINDAPERLHKLTISTLQTELPNFDSLELYATFEQID